MKGPLARFANTCREYFTQALLAGIVLAATGAAPEHWLAGLFAKLRLPSELLHLGTARIDLRLVAAGLGVALIAGDLAWRRRRPSAATPPETTPVTPPDAASALHLPNKPSLVVLPFLNMSGDPEQDYFSDGIVEDTTTALSRIPSLFVISRGSAFTFKGRTVDVREVGRELGVQYVLQGSIRKAGTQLRIAAQLTDAMTGINLWAEQFDGVVEDVFAFQDRIAERVAGVIEPRLQSAEIVRALHKPTQALTAYDFFLRGMATFNQGARPEQMDQAQALFRQAYELDPDYGAAFGMAALCVLFRRVSVNFNPDRSAEATREAARLAALATSHGRDDPNALWAAGYVTAFLVYDLQAGMALIERACTLNPNSAMSWQRAGYVRAYLGEYDLAVGNFERAIRLSPVDPLLNLSFYGIGMTRVFQERFGEAVEWAERAVRQQPDYISSSRLLAVALAHDGRLADARQVMHDLLERAPDYRLSDVRSHVTRLIRDPKGAALWVDGLRQAGMPE